MTLPAGSADRKTYVQFLSELPADLAMHLLPETVCAFLEEMVARAMPSQADATYVFLFRVDEPDAARPKVGFQQ